MTTTQFDTQPTTQSATVSRADALQAIRDQIEEAYNEARDILAGTGSTLDRAKAWLSHLDEAIGSEPTTTIDDTIEELRAGERADDI